MRLRAARMLAKLPVELGVGKRANCVVDGDTIWFWGEKIRLEGFNTPGMAGACPRESQLARRVQGRLSTILSNQAFTVQRGGWDAYGRRLATVRIGSGDVGDILISEGLAHAWRGFQQDWCA